MQSQETLIINKLGLHARAAAKFVNLAKEYKADIKIKKDEMEVNGKSILGILMLGATKDSSITIIANGKDEQPAMDALIALIADKFGESE